MINEHVVFIESFSLREKVAEGWMRGAAGGFKSGLSPSA
jgi:hypothetical protein